jgi:hypothetical protein
MHSPASSLVVRVSTNGEPTFQLLRVFQHEAPAAVCSFLWVHANEWELWKEQSSLCHDSVLTLFPNKV